MRLCGPQPFWTSEVRRPVRALAPHFFPDTTNGSRPLRRPFGKRYVSKLYMGHISYCESLLREALFLCPGVPLGRQPHGPPPPPKKPAALPTEETPRPVHSPSIEKTDKSAAFLLPRASVFAIFIRGPPAVELPFAASTPRSRASCLRKKGIKPAWPRPRHILYTVCIPLGRKKHNKITRRKPRILDSSLGLLYQRLTPL